MENATEALKMAFAVLVFIMAMSLAFMMVTQARSTADVVFQANDKQEYVENITSIGQDANNKYRIVGLDTIIPTIYRYAQENYGVTIIEGNDIVALYDLQIENTISNISTTWGTGQANEGKFQELCLGDPSAPSSTDTIVGIQTYINQAVDSTTPIINYDINKFQNLFGNKTAFAKGIYTIKTDPTATDTSTYCPWTSNPYNIMKRIKADMNGETVYFGESSNLKYDGKKFGTSKNKSFMDAYGSETFKEYYYTVKTENPLTGEEETSKLQIIYVKE